MDNNILSVGIDIGTSTTQLVFSRLRVENTGSFFTVPKISIVGKEVIYKSEVYRTPLQNSFLIDGDKITAIVESEFQKAGFTPKDTATGAVIITGESARKENAALVLEKLSRFAGDFVVSTAGPDIESVIAGRGSGAGAYSEQNSCVAANLDIGGGTTNIAVFDCGEPIAKGCFDIGGRQIVLDGDKLSYVSDSAVKIAERLQLKLEVGTRVSTETLKELCSCMAALLEQALGVGEKTPLLSAIETSGSSTLSITKPVRAVFFSGGVADCIYKSTYDDFQYGDIGVLLGKAIRNSRLLSDFKVITPGETIRATVVGAGTYTTTISGSTITYTDDIFPLKNIPVLKLSQSEEQSCFDGDVSFLKEKLHWFLSQNDEKKLVLALSGRQNPSYGAVMKLADCVFSALDSVLEPNEPMLLLVEKDMAKALGQAIKSHNKLLRSLVSVDSIRVEHNNYIDMGAPLMDGLVIPVVVKTLIFG